MKNVGLYCPNCKKWLLESIDWKSAAEKLKKYYKHITFDGTDFWYRV